MVAAPTSQFLLISFVSDLFNQVLLVHRNCCGCSVNLYQKLLRFLTLFSTILYYNYIIINIINITIIFILLLLYYFSYCFILFTKDLYIAIVVHSLLINHGNRWLTNIILIWQLKQALCPFLFQKMFNVSREDLFP